MRGRSIVVGGALMVGCGVGSPPSTPEQSGGQAPAVTPAPARTEAPVDDGFEAVVRVEENQGGKNFQGVWLARPDGERWVVAYRPEAWLRSFEGRTVRVTGEKYQPDGQAVLAPHFRIRTLKVVEPGRGVGPLLGVGPEQTLTGNFRAKQVPPGAKNEGDTYWTFVAADGTAYMLESVPEGITDGAAAQIRARAVEPDWSYTARRGGDYLWVLAVEAP